MEPRGFCPRCDEETRILRPWRGFRALWWAWCAVVATLAVLLPFYFLDVCVMVPSAMLITLAGGPLRRLASEKPICRVCSAEIDERRRAGTGVRIKPLAPRPGDDERRGARSRT